MKKSVFVFILSSSLTLGSCAQFQPGKQPSGEVVTYYPAPVVAHKEYSLFELGHSLSNNSVDVFDPALTMFASQADSSVLSKETDASSSFPIHPSLLVQDSNVTVFSLYSTAQPEAKEIADPPLPSTAHDDQLPP